jgi:hypothetical protein
MAYENLVNPIIADLVVNQDKIRALRNQVATETLLPGNTSTPAPTISGSVWTLKQNTATSGVFVGIFKSALSTGCMTFANLTIVSHTNPTSGKPARFLACGATAWQDTNTLQEKFTSV